MAAIAASPMSISARQARKSAERLEERKKPEEVGKPGRMRGKPICGVRPAPLIGPKNFRWLRELSLEPNNKVHFQF